MCIYDINKYRVIKYLRTFRESVRMEDVTACGASFFYSIVVRVLCRDGDIKVHRCGTGGSLRACHAAGPGSIPGRDKFPG